jgi:hypothetical protein
MAKIASIQLRIARRYSPVLLAIALALPLPVLAQDANPGSFSLPPGPSPQPSAPSDVQGPVDNEPPPPRRTDEPAPAPATPPVTTIAPVPAPQTRPDTGAQSRTPDSSTRAARERQQQRDNRQTQADSAQPEDAADAPATAAPQDAAPETVQPPAPATTPPLPQLTPDAVTPDADGADDAEGGSIFWWLAAGFIALISLIVMAMRQRAASRAAATAPVAAAAPTTTVPTPPLRRPVPDRQSDVPVAPRPSTAPGQDTKFSNALAAATAKAGPAGAQSQQSLQSAAPRPAPAAPVAARPVASPPPPKPTPAPIPTPQVDAAPPANLPPAPRLLLDFTTLGVDVTLINAVARFHLAITNMADIPLHDLAVHGAVVQARRGMPPTVDPLMGDQLLPALQKMANIAPGGTERCEGQIRLPLSEIEPIEMQGRLLFVPVVHIWIGYSGPDETRYAVTQSFVLGEESNPPGPRVGPLRLDLGPRRFSSIGQRPLQPA